MSITTPDLAKLRAEINQHPYVKLLRSKDPMMWYSSRVGEMIRVIGVDLDGYWAREGDKYNSINVIRFSDCEWVPHPLSHITPSAPDASQGNNPAWTLASKVREALHRKACPGYYIDVAVEAVVHNYIYAPAPSQEPVPGQQPDTFRERNAQFREQNWQIRFDAAVEARRQAQEQLYSERERHNSEIQALRQEISRLLSSQQLRRLDAALTDEFNNRDVLDKMLTQCIAERDQLRAQLSKAVAEEREACALECESRQANGNRTHTHPDECAAAIRARSNT